MNRSMLVLGVLLFSAFLAGRWTQAEEEEPAAASEAVRALRYRIVWTDSALDLSHGGGRWVHELFFPDTRVTATLVFEHHATDEYPVGFERRPRVYVGRSDKARTDLTGLSGVPPQTAEEVQVPRKIAKALAAFADLNDRYRAEGTRLGAEFASALGLKPMRGDAGVGSAPPETAPETGKE